MGPRPEERSARSKRERRLVLWCAHRDWAVAMLPRLRDRHPELTFEHVATPAELTPSRVRRSRAAMALFPDWSWRVPDEILDMTLCIGFHAAPLPAFRGGSPIQNQIAAGVERTALTAFRMSRGLDAGEILLQSPLSLRGSLRQIFGRIRRSITVMVGKLIAGDYRPRPQVGTPRVVRRRRPEESELRDLSAPLDRIYDHIRMLADPYPNAFLRLDGKRLVFKSARLVGSTLRFTGELTCESS